MWGYETALTYTLSIIGIIIVLVAQGYISITYRKMRSVMTSKGLTGAEVARMILDKNGLQSVYVVETKGSLSDHYDPKRKVVRLSHDIYNNSSVASVSVAAHEVGHAIQDKEGYSFMRVRSLLFPLANLGSKLGYIVIIIGLVMSSPTLAYYGIFMLLALLLFQIVTLPVEYNASKRANVCLNELNILDNYENGMSKKMLNAAALTYVAGMLSACLEIIRLLLIIRGDD